MERVLKNRRCLFVTLGIFLTLLTTRVPLAQQTDSVDRHPVIVIMKNRLGDARAASDRESLMSELRQASAEHIKVYRMVNILAASVADDEIARLKTNPAVDRVIPDVVIHRKPRVRILAAPKSTPGDSPSLNTIPGACGDHGHVLLDPEALQITHTDSDDPLARTARSLGLTGAGVRVAWMADGIDPGSVNFIRSDGTSAFVDYQDFSGDGAGALTSGDEAFLDANAIAGQGIHVYDISGFSAQSDPSACNIRIEGVAPGAEMIGLKVFSQSNSTYESNFLQAIEYAVFTAHVDVLNESFGDNFFPDTSRDIVKLFNDAAVNAGVTVTVSSGDSGSANTIGSPATDPLVISVGGSTTFRFYAQTNFAAARYFATTGWLDDNISSLSSAGFTESGRTLDLVAPADLGFASCDASSTYQGCLNFLGQASDIEESGGTSMSAPLTAGAAALVIQAYRSSHQGASPTPGLVKQILLSTATDLGVPAIEQGAGLLDSYKAVLLAESVNNGSGLRLPVPLLLSDNQLNAAGAPGTSFSWPVTLTNTATGGQFVRVKGRTFGPATNIQSGQVTLNDATSLKLTNYAGLQNNYGVFTFSVPHSGADRLSASIAYPGNPASGNNARVRLILIDPRGRLAAHSLPQGVGDFGNVDVRKPVPGTWTGVIFGDVASTGGTNGTVPWQVSTQTFVPFGAISPSRFFLFPGESKAIRVTASAPPTPGDIAGSIVVTSWSGGVDPHVDAESSSIPVTLRSRVDVAGGGAFQGVLTGGNGRPPGEGQVDSYQFHVDPGHANITANVSLSNDAGVAVGAYLVSPDGDAVGFGQNSVNGTHSLTLAASALNPAAGDWTLIVDFAGPVVGDEISQVFSGNIQLDNFSVSAPLMPDSQSIQLAAGTPVNVPVTLTNNSAAPEAVFIDARLNGAITLSLAAQAPPPSASGGYPIPEPASSPYFPLWLVPTRTSSLQVTANANVLVEFDFDPSTGDPDLYGAPSNTGTNATTYSASGSYSPMGGAVSQGLWLGSPAEIGPYPSGGAPSGLVSMSMNATTEAFDPTVTCQTGDLWLLSLNASYGGLAPMTVNPGQTTVINVTLTPSGPSGSVVSGNLYVDAWVSALPPYGQSTGNELAVIPYTYTVK